MSIRVLPHASDLRRSTARESRRSAVRGATPFQPRGARNDTRNPPRRIRDDARDGLAAAAVSLSGSLAVTLALALLLRWLG